MAPTRLPVLIAATLAATSNAIEFGGHNDITQATVAPGSETQTSSTGSYDSTNQWTQTASSSNNVPTMTPTVPSSVSGSQGWSQPTGGNFFRV
ncbi:hypothetical protein PR003_g30755 [Phytophthora rubi]|uniref:RxLR effector protein n=1 Tax=Phytophthora rubi TaxID=129364 RepID=A0A6A3GZ98_9STRA|nr:hypothetical protein PR002_g29587 [Phytophthora rubi]KAE8962689.1 hypothetical protein PR001_g29630 [Phytophthora rubi]KAE9270642.1 hypothetical protein PR003_g30755 [Phytophthora rubi]